MARLRLSGIVSLVMLVSLAVNDGMTLPMTNPLY
jgi:hypothetical protein